MASAKAKITVVDHGMDAMEDWIDNFGKIEMKVGAVGANADTSRDDGVTNGELMFIHEHGADVANIPERAPLRTTFDMHKKKYRRILNSRLKMAFDTGASPEKALAVVGDVIVGDIQSRMLAGELTPELQPATIKAKGGDTAPLVDTGILAGSLDKEIKSK
ncbi:MAG: hypothetical protein KAV87_67855 [Desulfobacteraceae bacterium]|nr:hypothetical protein [Desulfobacteraceae bacterium]